jgi:hypothetical protein
MTESNDSAALTATVHIIPGHEGWHVVRTDDGAEASTTHTDLGNALDEATRGPILVHVVVHSRDAADAA